MAKIKVKPQPINTEFGNHMEQGMLKGLNSKQRAWALSKLKELKLHGGFIHYGFIREEAKRLFINA